MAGRKIRDREDAQASLKASGLCLFSKRLEAGTFELLRVAEGINRVAVDQATLASLLEGIDLNARRRRWYRRERAA